MPAQNTNKSNDVAPSAGAKVPSDLDQILAEAESARSKQLASLPESNLDPVTAAHRASVERILEDIRTARRRLAAGLYGVCASCGSTIPAERLDLRAWATACVRCDRRHRP